MAEHHSKSSERSYTYPLHKYLKTNPAKHTSIHFSKFGQSPIAEEDIKKLGIIKNIVKSAEIEINNIASCLTNKNEGKVIHLPAPDYFDDDFDQKTYIDNVVSANLQGMKIVEQDTAVSKIKKMMMLKQALESVSDQIDTTRTGKSSQAISGDSPNKLSNRTVHTESQVVTAREDNNMYNKKNNERLNEDSFTEYNSLNMETQSRGKKFVRLEDKLMNLNVSNHKLVEIKSEISENIPEIPVILNPKLSVQIMPSVNIRSQLMEQKIPSLDIFPGDETNIQPGKANNVALVQSEYGDGRILGKKVRIDIPEQDSHLQNDILDENSIKKMSGNQILEHNIGDILNKIISNGDKKFNKNVRHSHQTISTKLEDSNTNQSYMFLNRSNSEAPYSSIPSTSFNRKVSKLKKYAIPDIQKIYNPKSVSRKPVYKKSSSTMFDQSRYSSTIRTPQTFQSKLYDVPILKNDKGKGYTDLMPKRSHSAVEYIPYSKLTIGGYNVKEAKSIIKDTSTHAMNESEMSILNSGRFVSDIGLNESIDDSKVVLSDGNSSDSSSDDSNTKSEKTVSEASEVKSVSEEEKSQNEYDDDFDDDVKSTESQKKHKTEEAVTKESVKQTKQSINSSQTSFKKSLSLNLKKKIDVYDYVHSIEKKDDSTQSGMVTYSNFKETQTSPIEDNKIELKSRDSGDRINITNLTIGDMLQIQKSLSILNANFFSNQLMESNRESEERSVRNSKPCETKEIMNEASVNLLNVESSFSIDKLMQPKNTQTSPLKTSHTMTSPTEMVHRILSPIFRDTKNEAGTNSRNIDVAVVDTSADLVEHKDLVVPKLQLTEEISKAKEQISNSLDLDKIPKGSLLLHDSPNYTVKYSTDALTDVSHSESSETHSLGEINLRILRKKSFIIRRQSKSNSNSHSLATSSSSDVQLDTTQYAKKSDGELSLGQILSEK